MVSEKRERTTFQEKPEMLNGRKSCEKFPVKSGITHFRGRKFFGKESQWLPTALCSLLQNGSYVCVWLSNFSISSTACSGHSSFSHDSSVCLHSGSSQSSSAVTFLRRTLQGPAPLSPLLSAPARGSPGDGLCLSPQTSSFATQHFACSASHTRPATSF